MTQPPIDIIAKLLSDAGYTPIAKVNDPNYSAHFPDAGCGFILTPSPDDPKAVRVTATAAFTGQDQYEHWGEASWLANNLSTILIYCGATFGPDITGTEPNSAFDVYPPHNHEQVDIKKILDGVKADNKRRFQEETERRRRRLEQQ